MTDAVISAHARDGQLATRSSAPPLDRDGNQRSWEDVRNAVRELYEHGEHQPHDGRSGQPHANPAAYPTSPPVSRRASQATSVRRCAKSRYRHVRRRAY